MAHYRVNDSLLRFILWGVRFEVNIYYTCNNFMPGGNWRQVENRDRMYRFSSSYSSSRLSVQAFDFTELTISFVRAFHSQRMSFLFLEYVL